MGIINKLGALMSTVLVLAPTVSACPDNQADIVVRAGEYPNKPGKRIYIDESMTDSLDVVVHRDEQGYYVSEYDINYKLANRIHELLQAKGIKSKLLLSADKSEDLNRAGRKAMMYNPKMYLSIHHNYYDENSSGYFFMTNPGDTEDAKIAQRLSNSIKDNPRNVPQRDNRVQNNYIGEMNETGSTTNILLEGGFFSNPTELEKITSDEQIEYIARQLAHEIYDILK